MSIYDLLVRILMLKMIIVKEKLNLKKVTNILTIILSIILIMIIGTLIVLIVINERRYSESECMWLMKKRNSEQMRLKKLDWWENSVIYEVYLRSFEDSDGDGIGDIKGLSSKLEDFVEAGIDVILLSPIFTSHLVNYIYEMSDFYGIDHEFGTMTDFEDMLTKAHDLGIKVLLDFVPNHVSIRSEYFKLSENNTTGYENFFVWADARPNHMKNSTVPSNWVSKFGGSMWEWNDKRQQYYLHQFSKTQADINFREPAVREEIKSIFKFWLEKGVDGFKMDALPYLFEARADDLGLFPDEPLRRKSSNEVGRANLVFTKDLDEVYDVVYEWRGFIDEWRKENSSETKLLLADVNTNITNTMLYYGDEKNRSGAHFPLNLDVMNNLSDLSSARDLVYVINHWLTYIPHGRVANWVLRNHENGKMRPRYSPHMVEGLNILTVMLPGVTYILQEDKIGMEEDHVPLKRTKGRPVRLDHRNNRTKYTRHSKSSRNRNYITSGLKNNAETWLLVRHRNGTNNIETQTNTERTLHKVYQSLIKLRHEPSMSHGNYHIQAISANTMVLVRYLHGFEGYALIFNVGKEDDEVDLTREELLKEPLVVQIASTHSKRRNGDLIPFGKITLSPGEALVLILHKNRLYK